MRIHRIDRDQWIPGPPGAVFGFFSDAANLDAITPARVGFRIQTPLPIGMCVGARIEYRLRLTRRGDACGRAAHAGSAAQGTPGRR